MNLDDLRELVRSGWRRLNEYTGGNDLLCTLWG